MRVRLRCVVGLLHWTCLCWDLWAAFCGFFGIDIHGMEFFFQSPSHFRGRIDIVGEGRLAAVF